MFFIRFGMMLAALINSCMGICFMVLPGMELNVFRVGVFLSINGVAFLALFIREIK